MDRYWFQIREKAARVMIEVPANSKGEAVSTLQEELGKAGADQITAKEFAIFRFGVDLQSSALGAVALIIDANFITEGHIKLVTDEGGVQMGDEDIAGPEL